MLTVRNPEVFCLYPSTCVVEASFYCSGSENIGVRCN